MARVEVELKAIGSGFASGRFGLSEGSGGRHYDEKRKNKFFHLVIIRVISSVATDKTLPVVVAKNKEFSGNLLIGVSAIFASFHW
jgi:hypothetical protein